MQFKLDHATDLLSRTPHVLRALLEELPAEWTGRTKGEDTWSPFDVIGHLIHGERTDWIPRARIILEQGEKTPFQPFDRYAQFEASKGKSIEELLDTFESLRQDNLEQIRAMSLTPANLQRRGKHPELGTVTLEELLATWVAHDLDHLVQISRTMAREYREAVGPWQAYLSVMKK